MNQSSVIILAYPERNEAVRVGAGEFDGRRRRLVHRFLSIATGPANAVGLLFVPQFPSALVGFVSLTQRRTAKRNPSRGYLLGIMFFLAQAARAMC